MQKLVGHYKNEKREIKIYEREAGLYSVEYYKNGMLWVTYQDISFDDAKSELAQAYLTDEYEPIVEWNVYDIVELFNFQKQWVKGGVE